MNKSITKVSNPLTIIAIFAGLAEINGTVVLALVPANIQETFLWFIIAFPILLVVFFFITLNFNPKVIYAPSDFSDEDNFIKTLSFGGEKFKAEQVEVVKDGKIKTGNLEILEKEEWSNFGGEIFPKETKLHLQYGNEFNSLILKRLKVHMEKKLFRHIAFGIEAPEYFTLNYEYNTDEFFDGNHAGGTRVIIIRIFRDNSGMLNMLAIGKSIISSTPQEFADSLFKYIDLEIKNLNTERKHNK
jgi:hypothetical protein